MNSKYLVAFVHTLFGDIAIQSVDFVPRIGDCVDIVLPSHCAEPHVVDDIIDFPRKETLVIYNINSEEYDGDVVAIAFLSAKWKKK